MRTCRTCIALLDDHASLDDHVRKNPMRETSPRETFPPKIISCQAPSGRSPERRGGERPPRGRSVLLLALACVLIAPLPVCAGDIHEAVAEGQFDVVKSLIEKDPDLVSSRNAAGDTPLYLAAWHGQAAMVEYFLAHGAQVEDRCDSGETVLHAAVIRSRKDIVELLIRRGVEVDSLSRRSYGPLHMVNDSAILDILLSRKPDLNLKNWEGRTPLHNAIRHFGPSDVVKLLDRGAAVDAVDSFGTTPLHIAAYKDPEVLQLLIRRGAPLNPADKHGKTPLHHAVMWTRPDALKILLAAGADCSLMDEMQFTPLDFARRFYGTGPHTSEQKTILKMLEKSNCPDNSQLKSMTPSPEPVAPEAAIPSPGVLVPSPTSGATPESN